MVIDLDVWCATVRAFRLLPRRTGDWTPAPTVPAPEQGRLVEVQCRGCGTWWGMSDPVRCPWCGSYVLEVDDGSAQ